MRLDKADIQTYTDYYSFGSIARRDGTTYRYDYQGAYAEKDNITNWNNFELRMYDSRIGRWLGTDPAGQFATPYEGMGNNPVSGFDKTGGLEKKPDGTPLYDPGDWHVSDRLNNTDLWKSANLYNLQNENYDQYFDFNQHSAYWILIRSE
jgi:RHS repeat-associated protein